MLSFPFVDSFLFTKLLNFSIVPFAYFFCVVACTLCQVQEIIAKSNVKKFPSIFSFNKLMVLVLLFGCFVHVELIYVYIIKYIDVHIIK